MSTDHAADIPWALDDEHRAWRTTMREFCADVVAPGARQRSIDAAFDADLVRQLARLGPIGLMVPEEQGGGGDLRMLCIAEEELAIADSSLAVTLHVAAANAALLARLAAGRPDLLADLVPRVACGEVFVSFGLTEPGGGSDAGAIATRADRTADGWAINGAKQFISNSGTPFSRYVTLFAMTGEPDDQGHGPLSAFLVPLDAPGVTVGPPYEKLGWRSSDTHPLFFSDVHVPPAALLGTEGRGYREALGMLSWARIPLAAMGVGIARGCLDESVRFVRGRRSMSKPLGAHQGVSFTVADIAAMTATARAVTYDAAWKYDRGYPVEQEAAVAKLMSCELANTIAYKATQLHGGYGFIQDSAVTRYYQDARVLTIGEGTSEIQRLIIARNLGLGG